MQAAPPFRGPLRRDSRGRRLAQLLVCLMILTGYPPGASAQGISIERAQLEQDEDGYHLDARMQIDLPSALVDAVQHGIPLEFTIEFALDLPRQFWFDASIAERAETRRVVYNTLTRGYLVSRNGGSLMVFERLDEALREVSSVRMNRVVAAASLEPGRRSRARLRASLAANQLSRWFRLNALASRAWRLSPGEFDWEVRL